MVNFEEIEDGNGVITLPRLSKDISVNLQNFARHIGSLLLENSNLSNVIMELISEQVDSPRTQKIVALWLSASFLNGVGGDQRRKRITCNLVQA